MLARLKFVALGATEFTVTKVAWVPSILGALVVTGSIFWCLYTGNTAHAIPLAVGAMFVGLADVDQIINQRWRTLLTATFWITLCAMLGGLVANFGLYQVPLIAVVGSICGYVGVAGSRPALIGLLSMVTYAIFSGTPENHLTALVTGALVALGGLLQTAATVASTALTAPSELRIPYQNNPNLRRLRENLHTQNDFFRHGARLGLALAIAMALYRYLGWPHGYWIPMTVAWISLPNQNGTVTRVISRVAGSIAGVLITYAVIDGLHLQTYATAVFIGVGALLLLAFVRANYAVAVTGVTIFAISLTSLIGQPVGEVSEVRLLSTVIAGAIVIGVAFIWPSVRTEDTPAH
jgi:uncharacterized membrane protein YccC